MKKILCIDDDTAFTDMVTEVLKIEGYEVKTDSGKRLHEILKIDKSIALVLLDEQLMWIWGSELCKELKTNPTTRHIPVAMLSASNDIAAITKLCGADAFVKKPFELDCFLATVNRLMA